MERQKRQEPRLSRVAGAQEAAMRRTDPVVTRAEELRAMLAEYRRMTIEQLEDAEWGDLEVEIEGELWRLEQELSDRHSRKSAA
jgi:hypothetical protein